MFGAQNEFHQVASLRTVFRLACLDALFTGSFFSSVLVLHSRCQGSAFGVVLFLVGIDWGKERPAVPCIVLRSVGQGAVGSEQY